MTTITSTNSIVFNKVLKLGTVTTHSEEKFRLSIITPTGVVLQEDPSMTLLNATLTVDGYVRFSKSFTTDGRYTLKLYVESATAGIYTLFATWKLTKQSEPTQIEG